LVARFTSAAFRGCEFFKHPTDYDYISQDDTTLAAGDAVIMTMFTGGGFASPRRGLAIADRNAWPET